MRQTGARCGKSLGLMRRGVCDKIEVPEGYGEFSGDILTEEGGGSVEQNEMTGRAETLRTAKDSVFRNLFSYKENLFSLYQSLHPEDTETTMDDLVPVTLETILVKGMHNDLGFLAGDRLLILVEAQSTWSENILIRGLMYMAQTYQRYFTERKESLFRTKKVRMPIPEFYVVYTGAQKIGAGRMTLTDEYFGGREAAIDVRAEIIVEDDGTDILNQYIIFTRVFDEQVRRHGRTAAALIEAVRICVNRDVLKDYLRRHEKEVVDMMIQYYTQKEAFDEYVESERAEVARATALKLHAIGMADAQIAEMVSMNLTTIRSWLYPTGVN